MYQYFKGKLIDILTKGIPEHSSQTEDNSDAVTSAALKQDTYKTIIYFYYNTGTSETKAQIIKALCEIV